MTIKNKSLTRVSTSITINGFELNGKALYTVKELTRGLKVSRWWLYRLVHNKEVKTKKISNKYYIFGYSLVDFFYRDDK